jgi:FG-GAP-like repeat
MDGINLTSPVLLDPPNPGSGWRAVSAADFNGDGKSDIFFQNTDGTLATWYLDGVSLISPTLLSPSNAGAGWSAAATADINQDGNEDIVFQHTDGTLAAWYLNGVDLNSATLFNPTSAGDVRWRVAAATDLNGDGNADLIFQHSGDRTLSTWFLNGVDLISARLLNPSNASGTWSVVAP